MPVLVEALHDEEPLVRGHAARALGWIASAAAKAALSARSSEETDQGVVEEIADALALVGEAG